jgi:hypothetical protein
MGLKGDFAADTFPEQNRSLSPSPSINLNSYSVEHVTTRLNDGCAVRVTLPA